MITSVFYRQLDSTKLEYERIRANGSPEDRWIIRTGEQTRGQGRGENTWHSPAGGLWLSFDLPYPRPVASFPLYVGFCLIRLLNRLYGLSSLRLKWPNDIFLEGRKLAGILCAHLQNPSRYLVSLGMNTGVGRDDVLHELDAAILSEYIGLPVSNQYLAQLFIHNLQRNAGLLDSPETYISWCAENLYGLGRQAEADCGDMIIRGRIEGLSDAGFLLLKGKMGKLASISHGSLRIL
ncbi:MAG: biotin--[acetyl-CoA-carboxylase] ligase [Candidatus Cloacimonetes bacterium]|jgi:BirA family biotin operon repressor/biotin-[acetyl-CoA-carboxylase] ligase|nr:biotin--[acetyl-CoA-carboxylase] ligase [Candidatus Cloacimonadota bacterium]